MAEAYYAIALGSNQRHPRLGSPREVLMAAIAELGVKPLKPLSQAPIIISRPIGPSQRAYANTAILVASELSPPEMLAYLKDTERVFGRRYRGQKWRARVLDLDIILWSGGIWADEKLSIPHPHFRNRGFVLEPLSAVCSSWQDPVTGLRMRHLKARLDRRARAA